MCNPTLALAIGAQVAGTVVQNQASKRAQRARNEAIANNNATRMGLEDEARLAIDTSKNMFGQDQFDAGNQASQDKFAKLYNDTINIPNYSIPNVGSAPRVVQDTINNEMAKAAAFNKQQGEAKAKLASLGDYLATQVNPQFSKSAEKGQMIGNFIQGQGNILDLELKNAEQKAISPLAQILSGTGNAAMGAGLTKV